MTQGTIDEDTLRVGMVTCSILGHQWGTFKVIDASEPADGRATGTCCRRCRVLRYPGRWNLCDREPGDVNAVVLGWEKQALIKANTRQVGPRQFILMKGTVQ